MSRNTGGIAEYIDLAGSFHSLANAIFDNISAGKILGLIAHPILAETYYVSIRIYERLQVEEPDEGAESSRMALQGTELQVG